MFDIFYINNRREFLIRDMNGRDFVSCIVEGNSYELLDGLGNRVKAYDPAIAKEIAFDMAYSCYYNIDMEV